MEAVLEKTTKEDQKIAQSFISQLNETTKKFISNDSRSVKIKIDDAKSYFNIPQKALSLLFEILGNMAEGKSITLIPSDSEVGTQKAADMLNVSRPHLVKLLEQGDIQFRKVGTHRRIALKNLIAYESKLKKKQKTKIELFS
jgi:excisionase family DNA binding protein